MKLEKIRKSLNIKMWWILGLVALSFAIVAIVSAIDPTNGTNASSWLSFLPMITIVLFIMKFFVAWKIRDAYDAMNSSSGILNMILAFLFPLILIWITTPRIKAYISINGLENIQSLTDLKEMHKKGYLTGDEYQDKVDVVLGKKKTINANI